jgi:hypothetical protein
MRPGSPRTPLSRRVELPLRWLWSFAFSRVITATLLLVNMPAANPAAPPSKPSEYDVKAAYLLNFGRFVRFSSASGARSSFDICTIGHDAMGSSLDTIVTNTRIQNLPVHVTHLADISGAKSCAIVFISATESDHIREDLAILGNADVLTVSDAPEFLQRGGMIQFLMLSNHIRFAVNLEAVSRCHIVLSSELLRVASSVSGKPPTGELP